MNKKTKAQLLGITEFPYFEYDKNNKVIYFEWYDGTWYKYKNDENGNLTYYEDIKGLRGYYII